MRKLALLFFLVTFISCKNENKYYPEHGYEGKVKKAVITGYEAELNNGSVLPGAVLFQSHFIFDENGKKIDEEIDFSNITSDDFETTSTKTKYDDQGNWTEMVEYDNNDNPYSIIKRDFQYYPN